MKYKQWRGVIIGLKYNVYNISENAHFYIITDIRSRKVMKVMKFLEAIQPTINGFKFGMYSTPWKWHCYVETCRSEGTVVSRVVSAFSWLIKWKYCFKMKGVNNFERNGCRAPGHLRTLQNTLK